MKKILERRYLSYARNGEHFQLFQALRKVLPQEMAEELKIKVAWLAFSDALDKENEAYLNSQKERSEVKSE